VRSIIYHQLVIIYYLSATNGKEARAAYDSLLPALNLKFHHSWVDLFCEVLSLGLAKEQKALC
jgi:hypothetical protein